MPPFPLLLKDGDYDLKSPMTSSIPPPQKKEEEKTRDAKRQQQNSW